MNRRAFLKSLAATAAVAARPRISEAALPKAKITRVRIYRPPDLNETFNQSNMLCTVETDIGITGVGEGGTKDLLEQCAGSLIGKSPFQSEKIWQHMYIDWFYPPGREKIHAQGALDMALWDIKGKALKVPIHELLGGSVRNYCETYSAGVGGGADGGRGGRGGQQAPAAGNPAAARGTPTAQDAAARQRDAAKRVMEAGYRAYRISASGGALGSAYNTHEMVRNTIRTVKAVREGVGENGDWMIDIHQRFDYADALRCCKLMEEYEPYTVEDPVRDEHAHMYIPKLRMMTTCNLCHGEEWGQRYDFYKLVENGDIDYIRATLPNVGGITEMLKVMALCETHAVGIIPHFTGPIATAALIHTLSTFSGPVMMEAATAARPAPSYLPELLDFRQGKMYPNDRPGLGVTLDVKGVQQVAEITQAGPSRVYLRPDGSLNHW
jgi:galactonate dehydratase